MIFYNGFGEHEEVLRLSETFEVREKAEGYEWTARF